MTTRLMPPTLTDLTTALQTFAKDRDWDQFHSPKNLSMALAGEVGELIEHFQWKTEPDSYNLDPEERAKVEEEIADVLLYLLRLSDKLDIDLLAVAEAKLQKNAEKYPADRVRGSSKKYNQY